VVDPHIAAGTSTSRRRGLPPGVLIERRGSMLFTHFGLSGPAVLDVSRAVTGVAKPRDVRLMADFLPGMNDVGVEAWFRDVASTDGKRLVAGIIAEVLPRRLVDALLQLAIVSHDRRAAELTKAERGQLVEQLKRCEIRVTGSRGFEKAEVTAGGVALDEVDSRTMESKLVPNLFLAGEILDLDGFIGGYNFQAAFSTGWLAGESV
jgi:predicted Rossmann fold flavoprotein